MLPCEDVSHKRSFRMFCFAVVMMHLHLLSFSVQTIRCMLKDLKKENTMDAFLEIYSFSNDESWSLNNPGDLMLILEGCYCSL